MRLAISRISVLVSGAFLCNAVTSIRKNNVIFVFFMFICVVTKLRYYKS